MELILSIHYPPIIKLRILDIRVVMAVKRMMTMIGNNYCISVVVHQSSS